MRFTDRRIVRTIRQPEYTGDNRCIPCTAVNVIIAFAISGFLTTISPSLAGASLGIFIAIIYLRGYLIPGTPTLTKHYLPEWVLRHFDKYPDYGPATASDDTFDVEAVLRDAGAVTDCEHDDDLCLTDSFQAAWHDRISDVRTNDTTRSDLAAILDTDPSTLEFQDHGDAFIATVDERRIGQWESQAAFVADVAAAIELRDRFPGWRQLSIETRSRVLNGLRIFLEQCPACGGHVSLDQEVVESCCRSIKVVAATCNRR